MHYLNEISEWNLLSRCRAPVAAVSRSSQSAGYVILWVYHQVRLCSPPAFPGLLPNFSLQSVNPNDNILFMELQ